MLLHICLSRNFQGNLHVPAEILGSAEKVLPCGAVLQNFVMLCYEMTNLSSFFASRAQRAEENLN